MESGRPQHSPVDAGPTPVAVLVCTHCHGALERRADVMACIDCGESFSCNGGIADFAQDSYYDQFEGDESAISSCQSCGLANEEFGVRGRIGDFYLPLIRRFQDDAGLDSVRVLDSGCGNGLSVELLREAGVDAWGNDLSALRKWQWQQDRTSHDCLDHLVVADTAKLPFPDGFFDIAVSSGVLEHIGVDEIGGDTYSVTPRPDRDEARLAFVGELLRVVWPGGLLCLDFPNGAFPIDFWHGTVPGGARWHSRSEGFLPKVHEIRRYLDEFGEYDLTPMSPRRRLRMRQVGQHWWGRLMRLPMTSLLWLMEMPGLRWLAASGLNPYLVLKVHEASPTT